MAVVLVLDKERRASPHLYVDDNSPTDAFAVSNITKMLAVSCSIVSEFLLTSYWIDKLTS